MFYHLFYRLCGVHFMPSMLWCCWLGGRKGIRPVKNWVVGCWRGYLGWGADLHIAQQMPLPLTISCSSKSRLVFTVLVFTFLVPAHLGGPGQIPEQQQKWLCVCYVVYFVIFIVSTCVYISDSAIQLLAANVPSIVSLSKNVTITTTTIIMACSSSVVTKVKVKIKHTIVAG